MTAIAHTTDLPIIASVDVLVVGATSGAVAAALGAHAAGARVQLVSPRPYLGEDLAADLQLWLEPDEAPSTALAEAVFPGAPSSAQPITPMHAKLTLEQAVVSAGIPFLFATHPAGIVRDAQGAVAGCVIANRAGRQVIRASLVIDCTDVAVLAQQAGVPLDAPLQGLQRVTHRVVYQANAPKPDLTATAPASATALPPIRGTTDDNDWQLAAAQFDLEVDCGDGDWADLAHARATVVDTCWSNTAFIQSERLLAAMPPRLSGVPRGARCLSQCSIEDMSPCAGLVVVGPSACIDDDLRIALRRPIAQMALGERIGLSAGEAVRDTSTTRSDAAIIDNAKNQPLDSGRICSLADALRPGASADATIRIDDSCIPRVADVDVVVVGGGTGGAPAAISAARHGARTLVIEAMPVLGGVGTAGQIATYWFGNRVGFTAEIDREVAALEFDPRFAKGKGAWSTTAKAGWYHQEARRQGVTMLFGAMVVGVWLDGTRARGVVVAGPDGYGLIAASAIVDSSGSAEIPAAAGAPTVSIGSQHVAVQGTGLAGINGTSYSNSDHNFSDDSDVVDTTAFLVATKLKYRNHIDAGQLVDSRERRQIIGEASLDPADFLFERRFPDTICVASSNFDTHGFTVHPVFFGQTSAPQTSVGRCALPLPATAGTRWGHRDRPWGQRAS